MESAVSDRGLVDGGGKNRWEKPHLYIPNTPCGQATVELLEYNTLLYNYKHIMEKESILLTEIHLYSVTIGNEKNS